MHSQPGLFLPGHPEPALKGRKENMGSLLARACSLNAYAKTSTVKRSNSGGQGSSLFLGEGAGKVYKASCAWPCQELNGDSRDHRQQGKGQGCQQRAPLERVPAVGLNMAKGIAGIWQKAILSSCACRTAVRSKPEQPQSLSAHLPNEGLCQQCTVVLYTSPQFSLCHTDTLLLPGRADALCALQVGKRRQKEKGN